MSVAEAKLRLPSPLKNQKALDLVGAFCIRLGEEQHNHYHS